MALRNIARWRAKSLLAQHRPRRIPLGGHPSGLEMASSCFVTGNAPARGQQTVSWPSRRRGHTDLRGLQIPGAAARITPSLKALTWDGYSGPLVDRVFKPGDGRSGCPPGRGVVTAAPSTAEVEGVEFSSDEGIGGDGGNSEPGTQGTSTVAEAKRSSVARHRRPADRKNAIDRAAGGNISGGAATGGGQWNITTSMPPETFADRAIASRNLGDCEHVLKVHATRGEGRFAATFLARMKAAGVSPSSRSYSVAINACGREGLWRRALALLREAAAAEAGRSGDGGSAGGDHVGNAGSGEGKGRPATPNQYQYAAALQACAMNNRTEEIAALLEEMDERGVARSVSCYNSALKALSKTRRGRNSAGREAQRLLARMIKEGLSPNTMTYLHAILACKAARAPKSALDVLRQMTPVRGESGDNGSGGGVREGARQGPGTGVGGNPNIFPNAVHYSAVIAAFAEGEGGWQRALSLLKEMQMVGIDPNEYTFNSAINACAKDGEYAQAVALLRQMPKEGLVPDSLTYAAAIEACGKGKQWALAVALLGEMSTDAQDAGRSGKVKADVTAYTAAITACAESGIWERAISLFRSIADDAGLLPDLIAYNATIHACRKAGQWERALEIFHEITAAGLRPDIASFSISIAACAEADQWSVALALLDDMPRAGIAPRSAHYLPVVEACRRAGRDALATALAGKMGASQRRARRERSEASSPVKGERPMLRSPGPGKGGRVAGKLGGKVQMQS